MRGTHEAHSLTVLVCARGALTRCMTLNLLLLISKLSVKVFMLTHTSPHWGAPGHTPLIRCSECTNAYKLCCRSCVSCLSNLCTKLHLHTSKRKRAYTHL